jgi:hypothetical protein
MAGREASDVKTVVLAGNYREFQFWCRENDRNPRDRNLVFATEPRHIRGLGKVHVVRYGTYYMNPRGPEMSVYLRYLEGRQ